MKTYPILLIFICFVSYKAFTQQTSSAGTPWPKYISLEDAGFAANKLNELEAYIQNNSRTTGLLVVHDGKVVYEYGNLKTISYIASCRKSILSMLYGKYVDNGTIDLNQQIGELGIEEADGLLPIEKTATVDHIITSRSGVFHLASNGGYDLANFKERGSKKPGEYFVYNNWDFNVAGHLFEQYAGKSIYQELEEQLAIPLGFQDWKLKRQRKYGKKKNSQYPAYHIYVSTRDMAKMGQLMLNQGEWNGQQLISKSWIKKTTSAITSEDTVSSRYQPAADMPQMAYGYMWWLFDSFRDDPIYEGAYTASGYGGQYITVIPKAKLVIAHKTKLNLATKLGLTYKATSNEAYFNIVDMIVKAKK